ncbi:MAG: hypothetical protein IT210_20670 [Armatimonadetes bacterium]|nr:hypothetical protein [Armatimonadota bacterium]
MINLAERWELFWRRLAGDVVDKEEAVRLLAEIYTEKRRIAEQLLSHARTVHYQEFREDLERIAAEDRSLAEYLGKFIEELGGALPSEIPPAKSGADPFENMTIDLEDHRAFHVLLIEYTNRLQNSATRDVLVDIHSREDDHLETLESMAARTQPYTGDWERDELLL